MKTHHERIVELEADVAKLQWQVAQLIDAARKEHAEKQEISAAYDEALKAFLEKRLAKPYTDGKEAADLNLRMDGIVRTITYIPPQ